MTVLVSEKPSSASAVMEAESEMGSTAMATDTKTEETWRRTE